VYLFAGQTPQFRGMFPASRGEMAGVFLRARSVEAIVLERLRMQKKKQNPANS